jgi:hypothetical protein
MRSNLPTLQHVAMLPVAAKISDVGLPAGKTGKTSVDDAMAT